MSILNTRAPDPANWAGFALSEQDSLRQKKLMRSMIRTIVDYDLIAEGDHIMVAISGGKDSYTLLDLLTKAQKKAPFEYKLTAVHLDQVQPGYDGEPLKNWLIDNKIPHLIAKEDTYSIVIDKTKPGDTYCALCSRLRRGILYRYAEELGCNKIALGHHREDSLETMLLNMIYAGKLQAMPAKYRTDDDRFFVIRPLIETAEGDIAAYAKKRGFPILPCNLCGSQDGMKRQRMKELLNELEKEKPDVKSVMLNALKNVKVTHLLDPRFLGGQIEAEDRKRRLKIL